MRLTSRQLRRIIAEEVSRVIAEATGVPCKLVGKPDYNRGMFEFDAGGVGPLECEMGDDVEDTVSAMQKCASDEGVGPLNPQSCFDVASELHAEDMGDLEDTREKDFIKVHGRGPFLRERNN